MTLCSGSFIPDLIVNVDETAVHAKEHVTLFCGVSASGRRTNPVFIIKIKTVTAEAALLGSRFNYGEYGLQYSPNGWQDTVSSS
jgi:hypothetical protein